jgi:exodeoxyribonuclease V gamma subunit
VTQSMIQPGFMVLQSNRLENLRQLCVQWTSRYPLAPLENEVILVQSNGIAQWLRLALAADRNISDPMQSGCGIAAAINISLPGRFHWQAYRAVLGDLPETSPFDKDLLTWRLLRLMPALINDPVFAPLKHFLAHDHSGRKLFQLAQRLADLLDQYQIYRADWLNDWAQSLDRITQQGKHTELPADQHWQAALWRRLLDDIPASLQHSGRAQVHAQFLAHCEQLSPSVRPAGLPRRVIVFGLSSLPGQTLEVLAAIARCTQVILCVHNPSPDYWGDIVDDDVLGERGHPLLAAWGKQGRDYMRLLEQHNQRTAYEALFQSNQMAIDVFDAPAPASLLACVQADIFHLRPAAEARELTRCKVDGSVGFHIAHSIQREVEVLQDHLLTLFNRDPALQPRDVLVMVPDINQFAPAIQAVFGRINRDDNRYIPFTISDQGRRHLAPVYLALDLLLSLPSSRLAVSELLDFLDVPAVLKAFDISADEKPLLHRWVEAAGIRWGLNAQHRLSLGLPATLDTQVLEQNTWHFGLRRMLLGYASGRDGHWCGIEAYDEIGGLSAALAGKLDHLLQQLTTSWQILRSDATVADWTQRISALLRQFLVADNDQDLMLIARVEQHLQRWRESCEQAGFDGHLGIDVVREFVMDAVDDQETSQRFLAGAVNFATLMPMRAIPFRHICLLGMNDGEYPRQVPASDFDLMRDDYRPGDRSRREDDRYLFLEALLSARESLYVSWSGRSIRDNSVRPPSVLVAQLRDHVGDVFGQDLLRSITHEYPLQAFSRQYFDAASPLTTYASEWAPVHTGEPAAHSLTDTSIRMPSSAATPATLQLGDLQSLLRVPAEIYFQHVLGVRFSDDDVTTEDHEVFAVDGLLNYQFQQALISKVMKQLRLAHRDGQVSSLDIDQLLDAMLAQQARRGALPMPPFAALYQRETARRLQTAMAQVQRLLQAHPRQQSLPVQLALSDTLTLDDQLNDIYLADDAGQRSAIRCELLYSQLWSGKDGRSARVKWHYLARLWPAHLAAQLGGPVSTHIVGPDTHEVLAPLSAADAAAELKSLMSLWQQNLQAPLPTCVKTGCTLLSTASGKDPVAAAQEMYYGPYQQRGEVDDHYVLFRLWPDFDDLLQQGLEHSSQQLYGRLVQHWQQHRAVADIGESS